MASPKKNPKQANATKMTHRIGKKKRAEIIKWYRPMFEKSLSKHLEENQRANKRPELLFPSIAPPEDLPEPPGSFESCPVCRNLPYAPNIKAQPHLTLTEKDAEKYLRELGFSDYFVEHYLEAFRNENSRDKKKKKSAWGMPNIEGFISHQAWSLRYFFQWLTVTATVSILEDLLTEKGYTPGEGTIKKHLIKYLKSHKPIDSSKLNSYTDDEYSALMQESVDFRIEKIRRASEEAIKRAEEGDI